MNHSALQLFKRQQNYARIYYCVMNLNTRKIGIIFYKNSEKNIEHVEAPYHIHETLGEIFRLSKSCCKKQAEEAEHIVIGKSCYQKYFSSSFYILIEDKYKISIYQSEFIKNHSKLDCFKLLL